MALKKCKECGHEISSKAEACPHCGAKRPKKTSAVTWLVLIFIILVIYEGTRGVNTTGQNAPASAATAPKPAATAPAKSASPASAWNVSTERDEMTGALSAYAISVKVNPKTAMGFPYGSIRSWLGIGCEGAREWAYIGFSQSPTLSRTEAESGYSRVRLRVKWDDSVSDVNLLQEWGDDALHFRDDPEVIRQIANASKILVELPWYGQGTVYFEYPLRGSSKAIADMRAKCAKTP